jgi:tetratricopeptide (TPR) repeat protein
MAIAVSLDALVSQMECDQIKKRSFQVDEPFSISTFNTSNSNTDQSSMGLNGHFIHSQLVIDVLLRIKPIQTDMNELITLCKNEYKDNTKELENIHLFAEQYSPDRALWWYTTESFLYKIINKAFRVQNIEVLYLFRTFIRDMKEQLERYQCTSSIHVYRGQIMSTNELNYLKSSINNYISMNSFFSTTRNRQLAIFFLGHCSLSDNLERILFEIDVDSQRNKPFADISNHSAFSNEQEILFMAGSIFQLIEIFSDQNNICIVKMKLADNKENHLKDVYERIRTDYGAGEQIETNSMILGNVLQRMGKFNIAEKYYRRELNDLSGKHLNLATCFYNLAEVLREQGDYDTSLKWYYKSLEIDRKILSYKHANVGNTYNSIGISYEKKGRFKKALIFYIKALKITRETFGDNHPRVAMCLNNSGNAYLQEENYIKAFDCHPMALNIRSKNLPCDHPRIGSSHNNIGAIYHYLGYYDLALEHYKISLKINQKSLPSEHPDINVICRNIILIQEINDKIK